MFELKELQNTNLEISEVNWFPTTVYYTRLDDAFIDKIEKKVMNDKGKHYEKIETFSKWLSETQYEEIKELSKHICSVILPQIGQRQNWKYNNWTLIESWLNHYEKDDWGCMHQHLDADYAAILIIKPGEGNLIFSRSEFVRKETKEYESIHNEIINEAKGTLILFPPYLYHGITKCNKERMTWAFNLKNTK
tara:strand:+ start:2439 stop:3014 length:576 start_codon:yes stop_codon:yes gene_type:complete